MEEALVNKIEGGSEDFNREEGEDLALEKKDDLNHDGKDCVSDHDRDGQVDKGSPLWRPEVETGNQLNICM